MNNDALDKLLTDLQIIAEELAENDEKLEKINKVVNDVKMTNEEINATLDSILKEEK